MSIKGFFWGCIKLLSLMIGLFILGFLSALITMNLVMLGEQGKVPTLVGKDIVAALEELSPLGLNLKIESQEFHPNISQNTIISQKPEAGKLIKSGRTIKIILSKGTQMVTVPNVCDEPWLRAQSILQENALRAGYITKIYHQNIRKNIVISQDPPAVSKIQRRGVINLLVSEGREPRYYYMPEVIGKKLSEANQIFQKLRLTTGNISYKFYEGLKPDTIVDQLPKAGYRISQKDAVSLQVSRGKSIDEEIGTYTVLQYTIPSGSHPRKLRIMLQEGQEEKQILYEEKEPGDRIELLVKTTPGTVALIYLDGELVKEERF